MNLAIVPIVACMMSSEPFHKAGDGIAGNLTGELVIRKSAIGSAQTKAALPAGRRIGMAGEGS
jgi:hypothetical protein